MTPTETRLRHARTGGGGEELHLELPANAPQHPGQGTEPLRVEASKSATGWRFRVTEGPRSLRQLRLALWRLSGGIAMLATLLRRSPRTGSQALEAARAAEWRPVEFRPPRRHRPSRTGVSRPPRAAGANPRWLLGAAVPAMLVGVVLLLNPAPRETASRDAGSPAVVAPEELPTFTARPDEMWMALVLEAPMPGRPFKGQARPPCRIDLAEFEVRGGCWKPLDKDLVKPPCPRGHYEYQGRCWMAVQAVRPPATSIGLDGGQ